MLIAIGLNYKNAPINIREKAAISNDALPEALNFLLKNYAVQEAVILSTCNRVEIYCVKTHEEPHLKYFFKDYFKINYESYEKYLHKYKHEEAIEHLFEVACGLDSMVVGETYILRQVKDCFHIAKQCGATTTILNRLFQKAISVGKKVQSETKINKYLSSVPHAAVLFAEKITGSLKDKTIAVIGSGKIGKIAVRKIAEYKPKEILIINRSLENAELLAKEIGAKPLKLDKNFSYLKDCDLVISSTTAPDYVLKYNDVLNNIKQRNNSKPLIFIDLAVPRDIDPEISKIKNVQLYNIDDLSKTVDEITQIRKEEIKQAEKIIEKEYENFIAKFSSYQIDPVIKGLKDKFEEIRRSEEKRLFKEFEGFDEDQKEKINYYGKALINKLSHLPIKNIKENSKDSEKIINLIKELFEL